MPEISTKPYLLRAIYEWCTDNGYTPYIASAVDAKTRVPREFVKNGEIVLNISFTATSGLKMDNDMIHFHARFGGVSREIEIPVDNVLAIYARENGQGMAFEVPNRAGQEAPPDAPEEEKADRAAPAESSDTNGEGSDDTDPPKNGGRPRLTRIK